MTKNLPAKLGPTLATRCRYTKLKQLCAEYQAKRTQSCRMLEVLCDYPEVAKVLNRLQELSNELEHLLFNATTSGDGIFIDVTAESFELIDLLDSNSPTRPKLDRVTVRKYSKRLYAKHHPDRKGGNPQLFQSIKALVKANHVEGLYLMLLDTDFSDADDSVLTKMIQSMQGRLDKIPASNSWKVNYAYMAKGKDAAAQELISQLERKCETTAFQILGVSEKLD